jgi:hypothetical protein
VAATVVFCVLRAVPAVWEGARDFLAAPTPVRHEMRNQPRKLRAVAGPMATAR